MGGSWSEVSRPAPGRPISEPSSEVIPTSNERKRGHSELSEEDIQELSPKRKKIQTTSSYIYNTLFRQGVNSDITIHALGKEWRLHKVYLCQSDYFSSMFSGNWRESEASRVSLSIPDDNITPQALDVAFSSLYRDHVHLGETEVVPLIAAATMLQLNGLLEHCTEFMREHLSLERAVTFLSAASQYGLKELKEECVTVLQTHLVKSYTVSLLKQLSGELLAELLSSPELYVMQVEMDVYTLAKRWLYLSLHPDWVGEMDKLLTDSEHFFREYSAAHDAQCYLECQAESVPVFRAVRLQHILNDVVSVRTVETDKIIPHNWLLPLYRGQWLKMLGVDQRMDAGPFGMSPEQFKASSLRCGRVIYEPGEYCWRWTGFSFGFDVLIMYNSSTGLVNVKRNTRTQPCVSAVSMQPVRSLMIRLRATMFDSKGGVASSYDTGINQVSLSFDEEYHLLTITNSTFPLFVSVNLSLTSVDSSQAQSSHNV